MLRLSLHPASLLAIFSLARLVSAKAAFGESCSPSDSHLDSTTWALDTDCDATTYCADNGTCAYKGCRKDVYPYGYNDVAFDQLPGLCGDGQFCPDEGDQCLKQAPVGGACQKDRDDECASPSNRDLAGYLNVNGSVCLNFTCYWSNMTLGQSCIYENTPYTAYTDTGSAYQFIISRDNCANGLYCDGTAMQCLKGKTHGATCVGDKECLSYNCATSGTCGRAADTPLQPQTYVYILVGLGIVGLISGVMLALWFTHRRSRKENQIRLEQYYNEQIAYRKSIMSMSHAKDSLLALPHDTTPDEARKSFMASSNQLTDANLARTSGGDAQILIPPNMRRQSSAAYSDQTDSEVLLMGEQKYADNGQPSRRIRG